MRRFVPAIKKGDLETPEKVLEPYFRAIKEGDLATLKEIPHHLVNKRMKNESLITRACTEGRIGMVRYLLSFPSIEVDETELIRIAYEGCHPEIVKLLSEKDNNKINHGGDETLYTACWNGHLESVKLLLKRGDTDVNKDGYSTLLYAACWNGHLEIVKLLLERKDIDVNKGSVTLYAACWNGHLEIVRFLLGRWHIVANADHVAPLYAACWNGHLEIVKLLLKRKDIKVNGGKDVSPLEGACWNGHLEIVKLLLERKDIDVNRDQATLLYTACSNGHLEVVKLLLERLHIDVNKGLCTPLHAACSNGHSEIVLLLLQRKDIDVNKGKYTPLYAACWNGHLEIIELLLQREDIDVNKGERDTPLYAACEMNHPVIVQLLLLNGATVDEKTREVAYLKGISLEKPLTVPSPSTLALPSTNDEVLSLDKPQVIERQTLEPLAPKLKKCEWDLLDGSTDWYVFKPLLRVSKSVFTQNTINNGKFMHWINSTGSNSMERGVIKHLIECFLYGDEWPLPTQWFEWLTLLFIIDSSAPEWPKLTALCIDSLTHLTDMKMVADLIKTIHKYQQLAELFLVRVEESLLDKLERYAFSYIATQCREESIQAIYQENILSDPYFDPYYKMMNHLNRLGNIIVQVSSSEFSELQWAPLFNREDGDLEFNSSSIKCHRTILCTVSPHFETYFDNWQSHPIVESPVMVHIVRYCYRVGDEIPTDNLIPLMLLSHHLAMYDLFELAQSQMIINTDNFFTLLQQLEDYTGELSMEPLIERLVEFGIQHAKDLFITRNIPLLRGSIIDLIRLRK